MRNHQKQTNIEKGKNEMKMKTLANNQTVVEKEFETATFYSYDTEIAGLKWNNEKYGWELDYVTSAWDYSRTTTRYVYAFLREYNIRFETKDGVKYGSEAVGKELKKVVSEIIDANGEKEVEVQR